MRHGECKDSRIVSLFQGGKIFDRRLMDVILFAVWLQFEKFLDKLPSELVEQICGVQERERCLRGCVSGVCSSWYGQRSLETVRNDNKWFLVALEHRPKLVYLWPKGCLKNRIYGFAVEIVWMCLCFGWMDS